MASLKPFTSTQNTLIAHGDRLTATLTNKVQQALAPSPGRVEVKRHTYIYSPPGAGKTYTVENTAKQMGIEMVKVQGATSMNALITQLAVAVYATTGSVVVWIDDCDSIFTDVDSLNVMKGALDEGRNVLAWNKNLTIQIQQYLKSGSPNDRRRAQALQAFQPTGSVGVEVPTERIRFIITSNQPLTAPTDRLNTKRKSHEAAIRDRVNYVSFDLKDKEPWGWIASQLLKNNVLNLNALQKHILLDWMFQHWGRLTATSMRAVRELAADMLNHPDDYPDQWEQKLAA
jgi:hypothetical protein